MPSPNSSDRRSLPFAFAPVALLVFASLAAGCKNETAPAPAPAATQPAAAPTPPAAPPPAVSAQVAALDVGQLQKAARAAYNAQRLYAPAGDNAMEYYLALREKQPDNPAASSALSDLMPYALIATEQSIAREDFVEAQRLYALLEKADPQAPALPRLKQSIADSQMQLAQRTAQAEQDAVKQQEVETQRVADQKQAQEQAAQQLAKQQAEERAAAEKRAAEARAAQQAEEQRQAEARAAQQRAAQQQQQAAQPATPAAPSADQVRPVSTPSPSYPNEALRNGLAGEVQVEFTINPDGSVSNVRIVRADPPRVFDRAALSAVRRWRFQPVSAPITTRRSINFEPSGGG